MTSPRRGEVWTADLDPTRGHEQAGTRPVLVLSVDAFNRSPAGLVTVLPITRKARELNTRVPIAPPEGGLEFASFVIAEQVRTISIERLHKYCGKVKPATQAAVGRIVRTLLGFD